MKLGFLLSATDKMSRVIDEAVKKSTDKLNAFERTTAKVGSGFMKVGGAMTGAGLALGTAIFAASKNVSDYAQSISNASQKTGIGVTDLQKLAYAAERNNVNFDSFTGAMNKFNKTIFDVKSGSKSATTAFKDLGIKMGSPKDMLLQVSSIFARVPDGVEKSALAMELFGKSGTDLIPLLNQGAAGIDKLMKEAESLGLVLSEDAIAEANKFDASLANLKNTVTGASRQIGSMLIPYVDKAAKKVQAIIDKVVNWAKENPKTVATIIKVVTGLTGFLLIAGPIVTAIGGVIVIIGKLVSVVKTVIGVVKAVNAVFMLLAANPVVLVIAAIVAAVALLVLGFRYLWNNCEEFRNFWINLWDRIKMAVIPAIEDIKIIWEKLSVYAKVIFSIVKDVIKSVFGWIKEFWSKWGDQITNVFSKVFGVIKAVFVTVFDWIIGIVRIFLKAFQGDWAGAWEAVKDLFSNTWENIKNIFISLWDAIKAYLELAWDVIKAIFEKINPVPWLSGLWNGFANWFSDLKSNFFDWGKNIIQGLIDGVMSMFAKVKDTISNIGSAIKDKFTGLLGISSPSKIFAEYGLNITQGLTGGIETGGVDAAKATEGLAMQTVQAASNEMAGSTTNISNVDNSAFGGVTISYSPIINLTGSGNSSDITQALSSQKNELMRVIREYFENQRRISFA